MVYDCTETSCYWLSLYAGATKPKLRDLQKHATPQCAPNWWQIGLSLGCGAVRLKIIKADYPSDSKNSCTRMFDEWLQRDLYASWEKFFEAYDSHVGLQSTGK